MIVIGGSAYSDTDHRPTVLANFSLSLEERQPLVVGSTSGNYPYAYLGPNRKWQGFAVDLLDAVTRVTNLRTRREVASLTVLKERFKQGEFDLLQMLSDAPERRDYVDFSVPFLTMQGCLYVQKHGSPVRKLEDFIGRKFAIIGAGSIGEKFLQDHLLQVNKVVVGSAEEALAMVNSGACAGVFVSRLTALSEIQRAGLRNVTQFGEPLADYDVRHCFAVHKGDAQLLARLNEGLAILHRTGEFDEIYRRWFGRFDSPLFTREQVVSYVAAALALAFLAALWGLLRQRAMGRRIAGQAALLAEKEALLQALCDNIPMAMCVLEAAPDGLRLLVINRQAESHYGVAARQAAGTRVADLTVDPEWTRHLDELLQRWPAPGELLREERRLTTARKQYLFTLVPLATGDHEHRRICVLAEDVTVRRQLDEEIAQSRKLRAVGELVGGIAHEFNNLLTPVMLKAGEIQFDWAHDARLQQEMAVILQVVQRAAELTRRLLTFGRKADHQAISLRLEAAVVSCFDLLRPTIDRRILLQNAVPPELPPLTFNATDLNQILLNLLLNARDTLMEKLATRPENWTPTIRVEAAQLPAEDTNGDTSIHGWQRLTVRDNGMGMTAAVRERVFEPFYTTKEVGKGTGLGLATLWHLLTEAGGRIELDTKPGDGSAFHLFFPIRPAPAALAPSAPVPAPETAVKPARVFLAEDESLVAATILAALRRANHLTQHHSHGSSAWDFLQERLDEFDLLIFDVNMPGLSGLELVRRVRATGRYTGRIMLVSGRLTGADLHTVEELAVDRVVPKPFTLEEFLGAVTNCLQSGATPRRPDDKR